MSQRKDAVIALVLGLGAAGAVALAANVDKGKQGTYLDADFVPVDLASTGGEVKISATTDAALGSAVDIYVKGALVDSFTLVEDEFSATYDFGSNTGGTAEYIPIQLKVGTLSAIATVVIA